MKKTCCVLLLVILLCCAAACRGEAENEEMNEFDETKEKMMETAVAEVTEMTEQESVKPSPAKLTVTEIGGQSPDGRNEGLFVYKTSEGTELSMYVVQPEKQVYEYSPVLVNILGGGWTHHEVTAYYGYLLRGNELSREGYAGITVSYRGSDNGETMPDIIADVVDALGYIYRYNELFKIDLNRIVMVGQSAGGHVGLMIASAPKEMILEHCAYHDGEFGYHVIGTVAMVPPTMLYIDEETQTQLFPTWWQGIPILGHLFGSGANAAIDATPFVKYSPITYVRADMPPVLIGVGDKDPIVSPEQSYKYYEVAKAAGAQCDMIILQNADHSFQPVDGAKIAPTVEEFHNAAYEFVSGLLK